MNPTLKLIELISEELIWTARQKATVADERLLSAAQTLLVNVSQEVERLNNEVESYEEADLASATALEDHAANINRITLHLKRISELEESRNKLIDQLSYDETLIQSLRGEISALNGEKKALTGENAALKNRLTNGNELGTLRAERDGARISLKQIDESVDKFWVDLNSRDESLSDAINEINGLFDNIQTIAQRGQK